MRKSSEVFVCPHVCVCQVNFFIIFFYFTQTRALLGFPCRGKIDIDGCVLMWRARSRTLFIVIACAHTHALTHIGHTRTNTHFSRTHLSHICVRTGGRTRTRTHAVTKYYGLHTEHKAMMVSESTHSAHLHTRACTRAIQFFFPRSCNVMFV